MAEEAWRAELRDSMAIVLNHVDGVFWKLHRSAMFLHRPLHGPDAAVTTGASTRARIEEVYDDLPKHSGSLSTLASSMADAKRHALTGGSGDPAAPLGSIDDFQARDQAVWNALVRLRTARTHAVDARASVESACGFLRAAALILGCQPRPPRASSSMDTKSLGAINAIEMAIEAMNNCHMQADAALTFLLPAEEENEEVWWLQENSDGSTSEEPVEEHADGSTSEEDAEEESVEEHADGSMPDEDAEEEPVSEDADGSTSEVDGSDDM